MMSTLSWQCHECKASFFTQKLLSMHMAVFHKEVPVEVAPKLLQLPNLSGNKLATVDTDDIDQIDEAERERLENMFSNVKVVRKLHTVTEDAFSDNDVEEPVEIKSEELSEDEEHLEDSEYEGAGSQSDVLQQLEDEEMCILVVREDGMYLAANDVQNTSAEEPSQDEAEDSDSSDPAWSASDYHTSKQTPTDKTTKQGARERRRDNSGANVRTVLEFKCKRCDQVFPTKHERRLHLETHAKDLRFFCSECGRGFRKNQGLQLHLNVHTEGSRHKCPYCNNFYRTDRYLKEHIKLHMPEEYKFVCEICKKAFAHKTAYKYHMRSHFNVTPYICTICGKGYRQKSSLDAHMNMHEGARPYTCDTCGAGFRMKHTLRDHKRLHTNERPFVCKQPGCDKAYILKSQLKTHMMKHTGEKLHQCRQPGCDKRFFFESHRVRHERTAHRARAAPPGGDSADDERETVPQDGGYYVASVMPNQLYRVET